MFAPSEQQNTNMNKKYTRSKQSCCIFKHCDQYHYIYIQLLQEIQLFAPSPVCVNGVMWISALCICVICPLSRSPWWSRSRGSGPICLAAPRSCFILIRYFIHALNHHSFCSVSPCCISVICLSNVSLSWKGNKFFLPKCTMKGSSNSQYRHKEW